VLVGLGHKVVKAQRQVRAGSSVAGSLSAEGYVADAVFAATGSKLEAADAAADIRES
jgi:hypothetical protein